MVFNLPENLYTTDPNFTTLIRLLDDFDSYSREVQSDEATASPKGIQHGRSLHPRFDIRETKDTYELYGEVPGIERKNVHIELTGPNQILIRGHVDRGYADAPKKEPAKVTEEGGGGDTTVRFLRRERQVGNFAREFALPGPLQEFEISASMENGILKVVAPKAQPSKGRKIEIS
ncbi:HSP20-like chaperone [Bombardia bombarda]|uniref:HSP20-like chaperone n=1 Tax=Bombardia bombarda TaxID=252184 RepID=A0AA39XAZ1_9PEZI|nr:HSP20-like chaperone [Bombardia bombarda]